MALRNKKKIDFLNIFLIGAIFATIAILVSELVKMLKKKKEQNTENLPQTTTQTVEVVQEIDYDKTLQFGTNAKPEIRVLQTWINADGGRDESGKPLIVDGFFGVKTQGALYDLKGVKKITLNQYRTTPIRTPSTGIIPDLRGVG